MKLSRPVIAAALAVAAAGAVSVAHARDNVYFSIGANVAPGVSIGASNYAPRYYAPAPVYYAPAPVYYEPAPVYYEPAPVVWGPRPVFYSGVQYYWSPQYRNHYYVDHKGHRHWRKHH
ncbi:hypothetical protein [Ramlibacter sp. PS4R-6]|uniref:hypothetical protein n=1 Tax=Ramlibacter sp. PS4R-6 TaxID=3133438 RepID=UPI0030B76B54